MAERAGERLKSRMPNRGQPTSRLTSTRPIGRSLAPCPASDENWPSGSCSHEGKTARLLISTTCVVSAALVRAPWKHSVLTCGRCLSERLWQESKCVGQAFQPDLRRSAPTCQAGKPDLRRTGLAIIGGITEVCDQFSFLGIIGLLAGESIHEGTLTNQQGLCCFPCSRCLTFQRRHRMMGELVLCSFSAAQERLARRGLVAHPECLFTGGYHYLPDRSYRSLPVSGHHKGDS